MIHRRWAIIAFALFVVFLSGCLHETSVEDLSDDELMELAEELQSRAADEPDILYPGDGEVIVMDKSTSEDVTIRFSGAPDVNSTRDLEVSGRYVWDGDGNFGFTLSDDELEVRYLEQNDTIRGVDRLEDLGETFEVDLGDRRTWIYQTYRDELEKVVTSEIKSAAAEADQLDRGTIEARLDSDEEHVADLIVRTLHTIRGESLVELQPEDIEDSRVTLDLHEEDMEFHAVGFLTVEVETEEHEIEYQYLGTAQHPLRDG